MAKFKRPTSIRSTLLILLLPSAILFMSLAWSIHGTLLDRMTHDFVQQRLVEEADFLEELLVDNNQLTDNPITRAGDYFKSIFHHSFAIHSDQESLVSPENWQDALQPLLSNPQPGFARHQLQLAQNGPSIKLLVYQREISVKGEPVQLLVAEDLTHLEVSQRDLHLWTAFVALGLLLLLIAMIYGVVHFSLSSTVRLQDALHQLQQGERRRLELANLPREFAPLVKQINLLLEALEQRLKRSRNALANLSHSIKTPIAAVQQMLEDKHSTLTSEHRTQMALRLRDIHHQLEKEIRLSHFAGPQAGQHANPVRQTRDLLWVLGRLYPDKHFEMDTTLDTEYFWPLEEQDMNELLGNLLDNAGKWAQSRVLIMLEEVPDHLKIQIQDNGPGVDARYLSELGTRGLRLDEQTPGHGLGLAIVHEIVQRYGGNLVFTNNSGLTVSVYLPRKTN